MTIVTKCLVITFITASSLATSAAVADERVHEERYVTYADLNLDRPEGVDKLYRRLRHAALSVCGGKGVMQLVAYTAARTCARESLREAVIAFGHPSLIEHHAARTRNAGTIRTADTR